MLLVLLLMIPPGCQHTARLPHGTTLYNGVDSMTVVRRFGESRSETGCLFEHIHHQRRDDSGAVRVVLAHGFLRDQRRMRGLAMRLAQRGLATVTLDLCNMRPWDGAHRQNARDMVQVARKLGGERVVYAGFSAGGLAALLAAQDDTASVGVFALDLVDRGGIGRRAASALQMPLLGVIGEPSSCNAFNNGSAIYAAAGQAAFRTIAGATHCDFESPTDWICELFCDSGMREEAQIAATRTEITRAALDAIEALATGGEVWPDGYMKP